MTGMSSGNFKTILSVVISRPISSLDSCQGTDQTWTSVAVKLLNRRHHRTKSLSGETDEHFWRYIAVMTLASSLLNCNFKHYFCCYYFKQTQLSARVYLVIRLCWVINRPVRCFYSAFLHFAVISCWYRHPRGWSIISLRFSHAFDFCLLAS